MKMKFKKQILAVFLLAPAFFQTTTQAQSLWHDETSRAIFADKRAGAIGDIVTIVVQENTTANKNNETKTEKNSSLSAAVQSFLYPASAGSSLLTHNGQLPAMAYNSDLKHDGSGAINNSESIVAHVACKVIDVLPNKNLVLEGKRETSFSGEHQTILLHGVVRAEDVAADNTVLSYNVADATIEIIGKGTVSNSQNKGWFTRIWDVVNPF